MVSKQLSFLEIGHLSLTNQIVSPLILNSLLNSVRSDALHASFYIITITCTEVLDD